MARANDVIECGACGACGEWPCLRCQIEQGLLTWSAHDLVDARRELAGLIDRIDGRLRELDGRATAGNPSLRVTLRRSAP